MSRKTLPARNPESRMDQLINDAVNLAEKKLKDGTASSQIITTLLNYATTKYQLENEKLRSDLKVADAKIKAIESQNDSKDLYAKALAAFRSYQGVHTEEDEFDEEDEF